MAKQTKEDALLYHSMGKPGKIEVVPTKPYSSQRDLSLAYSPGVAEPCLEIEKNPDCAYEYTAKGTLVAVISNGTAVLGLGNIGAMAGKPVMEGKGLLFKIYADIDVFDIELNTKDAITKKELDESKYKVQDIQSQIEIQLSTIKQQQTKLKEFNADMQYFQTLEKRKIVLAPNNGTVLSLAVKEGQFLNSTQKIGDFAPIGPLMAITEIDELYADKIKIGQKAVIKKQGKEEEITTGIVKLTSPYLQKKSLFSDNPSELEDRRVREVRIQIDEPDKVLIGARVECVIKLD